MVDEVKSEEIGAEADNEKTDPLTDPWWEALGDAKKRIAALAASNAEAHAGLAQTRAQLAAIQFLPAQITQVRDSSARPWWAPDAQGMLAGGILLIAASSLFVRMLHTSPTEDKMLDTMITILFSTCLVTVYQYTFGSSRGSSAKDDTQNKLVEKLMPPPVTSSTTTTKTGDA